MGQIQVLFCSGGLLFFKPDVFPSPFASWQSKDAGIRTLVMLDEQGGKWIGTQLAS